MNPAKCMPELMTKQKASLMAADWLGRDSLASAVLGLRAAVAMLLQLASLARGVSSRTLVLGMLMSHPYPASEDCISQLPMPVLVGLTGFAKTNNGDEKLPLVIGRNRHETSCAIGMTSISLYLQFHVSGSHVSEEGEVVPGQGFPDLERGIDWQRLQVRVTLTVR
jgi:hypothetical protein